MHPKFLTPAVGIGLLLGGWSPLPHSLAWAQTQIGPVPLVSLAFQGGLQDQSIPRAQTLLRSYRFGRIQAEDVVRAGIEAGRVDPAALQDAGYLRTVDIELEDRSENRFNER